MRSKSRQWRWVSTRCHLCRIICPNSPSSPGGCSSDRRSFRSLEPLRRRGCWGRAAALCPPGRSGWTPAQRLWTGDNQGWQCAALASHFEISTLQRQGMSQIRNKSILHGLLVFFLNWPGCFLCFLKGTHFAKSYILCVFVLPFWFLLLLKAAKVLKK